MLFKKIPGDPQLHFFISKCKYCGKEYIKVQNKTGLCSDDCRCKSTQDSKAKYQQKRRLQIKNGTLIERDKPLGTMYLSKHAFVDDWDRELSSIRKECRRSGVKS